MESLIVLGCIVVGLGLFLLIRPLLPIERNDIRTSRKYLPRLHHNRSSSR